jgi:hypothetical protein
MTYGCDTEYRKAADRKGIGTDVVFEQASDIPAQFIWKNPCSDSYRRFCPLGGEYDKEMAGIRST